MPEPGRQGGNMSNAAPAAHAEHDLLLVAALPLLQVGPGASFGTAAGAPAAAASDSTQRTRAAAAASSAASAAPAASGPYADQFGPTVKSTGPGASGGVGAGAQPSSP